MAAIYPDEFRCAQIQPYSIAVDMGILRTAMEGGLSRQRRLYRTMPHAFQLEFIMTAMELYAWQDWVNSNAYDYFIMPKLESMYSGRGGQIATPHNIRFTSNLAIDNPVYGWVRVKVAAELALVAPFDWISAGTPAEPAPDWIIAGTPAAPSTNIIRGGTPAAPG